MNIKKPIMQMLHFSVACLLLMCFTVNAQTLREDASLSDKAEGAPGATKLKAGSSVKVLKRQGFWVEVDAGGKNGWLKASQLNFTVAPRPSTQADLGRAILWRPLRHVDSLPKTWSVANLILKKLKS